MEAKEIMSKFDECISFLNNGELPYHDLKV